MCNREESDRSPNEQEFLLKLINEARKCPKKSRRYRKLFQQIISVIQKSEKLYKAKDMLRECTKSRYDDIYGEAFQRTLIEVNRKLDMYDEGKASVIHWFNTLLKYRILDVLKKQGGQSEPESSLTQNNENKGEISFQKDVPAPKIDPSIAIELSDFIECLHQKIEGDRDKLNEIFMRSHPNITAYRLLLFLFPPYDEICGDFPKIKDFAMIYNEEHNKVKAVELKRLTRFCRERCLPKLQSYVRECGWESPSL